MADGDRPLRQSRAGRSGLDITRFQLPLRQDGVFSPSINPDIAKSVSDANSDCVPGLSPTNFDDAGML
jgi:hypothetical protein